MIFIKNKYPLYKKKIAEKINKLFSVNYYKNTIINIKKRKLNRENFNIEKKYYIKLKNMNWRSNYEIDRVTLLVKILNYAKKHVPYYKNILGREKFTVENIYDKLPQIPLLTKEIIRYEGVNIYSDEFDIVLRYQMNTGGTTGDPLSFPMSFHLDAIHQRYLYNLMGYTDGDLIISLDGTRINLENQEKNIFWKDINKSSLPYGKIAYSTLYLNEKNIKYYIDHLNKKKPQILRGYPTGFYYIAKYIINNKIILNFKPKGIYLTAENIYDIQKINIENAFKCKIFYQYGHSEAAVFGHTNGKTNEYFCSPFYGFVEVINENNEQVLNNETGEIVVTGFFNKVMPFIRYKTGDLAVYGKNKNGIVILNKIIGRKQEYIFTKDYKKIFLIGLIYGGHMEFFNYIKRWQIIQNKPGEIEIYIVKDTGYCLEQERQIINLFSKNVKVAINYTDDIKLSKRGKHVFLIQNVKECQNTGPRQFS